jgi:hypothetical protein
MKSSTKFGVAMVASWANAYGHWLLSAYFEDVGSKVYSDWAGAIACTGVMVSIFTSIAFLIALEANK